MSKPTARCFASRLRRLACSAPLALALAACASSQPAVHLDPEVKENQSEFYLQARMESEDGAREAAEFMDKQHGVIEDFEWRDFSEQWRAVSDQYRAANARVSANDLDFYLVESWKQRDEIHERLGREKANAREIQAKLRRPGRNMEALRRSTRLHQRVNAALADEDAVRWTEAFKDISSDAGLKAALAYQADSAEKPKAPRSENPPAHSEPPASDRQPAPPSAPPTSNPGVVLK